MVKAPCKTRCPPTQKTTAEPTALTTPRIIKNQCPTTAWRMPISRTDAPSRLKRLNSFFSRPNNLTNNAPLILSVSFMVAFISAFTSIERRVSARKVRPIRRAGKMKKGKIAKPSKVSRHSSASMMPSVAISETTFEMMDIIVLLIARCAPITSLFSRDINSPVRVWVKKRRDMRCKCP